MTNMSHMIPNFCSWTPTPSPPPPLTVNNWRKKSKLMVPLIWTNNREPPKICPELTRRKEIGDVFHWQCLLLGPFAYWVDNYCLLCNVYLALELPWSDEQCLTRWMNEWPETAKMNIWHAMLWTEWTNDLRPPKGIFVTLCRGLNKWWPLDCRKAQYGPLRIIVTRETAAH